jgi:hypothetical protein
VKTPLSLLLVLAMTASAIAQDYTTGGPTITDSGSTYTPPSESVYDRGSVTYSGGQSSKFPTSKVIRDAGPILEQTVSGVPVGVLAAGALQRSERYLPEKYGEIVSDFSPYLSAVLSGGKINYGQALSTAAPYITDALGGDASKLYGEYGEYVEGLLNGDTSTGGLIRAGTGILAKIFEDDSSTFGEAISIIGALFGGKKSNNLEKPLAGVFSDPVTTAVGELVFSGAAGDRKSGTAKSGEIFATTGTVRCLYNVTCVKSAPKEYISLLASSAGEMGFSNPNEVQGYIGALSRAGVRPDAYSSRFSSTQNTYYMGNKYNTEIVRGRTEQFLSKAAQASQQKAIDAARETAKNLTKMSDNCDQKAKASQDLIRCTMKLNTATASFQAANFVTGIQGQVNDSMTNSLLADLSEAATKEDRARDVERSAVSYRLFQDAALKTPAYR